MNDNDNDKNDTTTMVRLLSSTANDQEQQIFEVSLAVCQISKLCQDAADVRDEDDDEDDDDDDDNKEKKTIEMHLDRVSGPHLAKIVTFMEHYHKVEMNEIVFSTEVFELGVEQKWYQDFVSDEALAGPEPAKQTLIQLVKASDYMQIKPLLDLVTFKMKCQMMGKSYDEICSYLELPRDVSHPPESE